MNVIEAIEKEQLRSDIPDFRPGDTLKLNVKVFEGNRERVQLFEGVCISRNGTGVREMFTVRRIASGEIYMHGKKLKFKHPIDAMNAGIGLITEDRRGNGIFGCLSIKRGLPGRPLFFIPPQICCIKVETGEIHE